MSIFTKTQKSLKVMLFTLIEYKFVYCHGETRYFIGYNCRMVSLLA